MMLLAADLARRQLERDQRATGAFPQLFARKVARMRASAHGFLRGSAPMFYEILRARPDLARGPGGEGWLVGDLHVENFGAYRPTSFGRGDPAVFGPNDFDDAIGGPWRFDMLRLLTSVLLAARGAGVDGTEARALAASALGGWCERRLPRQPRPIQSLLDKVRNRTRRELLADRTEVVGGKRRFIRGERYRDLSPALAAAARYAFAGYVHTLGPLAAPERFEIVDVAFRVAGTGSLGSLRVAVLVTGHGGHEGHWIFDMKEEHAPSASGLLRVPRGEPAARVLLAMRSCLARPPAMGGSTRLD